MIEVGTSTVGCYSFEQISATDDHVFSWKTYVRKAQKTEQLVILPPEH